MARAHFVLTDLFVELNMHPVAEEPAAGPDAFPDRMDRQGGIHPSFEQEHAITCIPAKREEPSLTFLVDQEQRAEQIMVNPQDDPKQCRLEQGITFHPDDPARISFCVELDDPDHVAQQAPGVFFGKEVRMEDFGELALFDAEVVDTCSQQDEPELDEDGATLSRPELEQAEIRPGVQIGEWMG